jgi:hypothetical protein
VLEPIQDISTNDTLAESCKQAESDKAAKDVIDAILVEQCDPQRAIFQILLFVNLNILLNKPISNQLRYNLYQPFLHHSHSLTLCFLLQDTAHIRPSGDLQQDVIESQLPMVETPESSMGKNFIIQIHAMPSAVGVVGELGKTLEPSKRRIVEIHGTGSREWWYKEILVYFGCFTSL